MNPKSTAGLLVLAGLAAIGIAVLWWSSNTADPTGMDLPENPVLEDPASEPPLLPNAGQTRSSSQAATGTSMAPRANRANWLAPSKLETDDLLAALYENKKLDVYLAVEALQRVQRCARYTRHPEGRRRHLERLAERGHPPDTLLRIWEDQDTECPKLPVDLNLTALNYIAQAADEGDFDAVVAYYSWGLRHLTGYDMTNVDLARSFTDRMRRYLQPIINEQPPDAFELLSTVYRQGAVYPRDMQLSASYRFAQAYLEQWPAARLDDERITLGRFLTDLEIDQAEQAGYELYERCCQ